MSVFIQIFLINLVVSCDNVGVVALATKGLPHNKAVAARRAGIWLSIILKLLFVGIVGFLFRLPWLHIRIVGGVLLLYVTFHMLRQQEPACPRHLLGEKQHGSDNFFTALVTIIAADVSMSLDNVLAILSIVSADGQPPNSSEMLLILAGLLLCVPVLLWFSETVSRLMERYAVLTCICGGYLAYIAIKMIFEDELFALFFQKLNFHQTGTTALLLGGLVCIRGFVVMGSPASFFKRRSTLVALCSFVVLYSLLSATVICYLETNPVVDGQVLSAQRLYEFVPNGTNAVFAIGAASELPVLCAAIYMGTLLENHRFNRFQSRFAAGCRAMALFVLLELAISSFLLSTAFGLGSFSLLPYLSVLLLQLGLLLTYVAAFAVIGSLICNKGACIALSILYTLTESVICALLMHHGSPLAGLLPTYYTAYLPFLAQAPFFLARGALIVSLFIGSCCVLGAGVQRPLRTKISKRTA